MDDVLAALAEQQHELASILDRMTAEDWQRPTRCDGWDVADVVLHVAQTNEMAVASARLRFDEAVRALNEGLGPARDVDEGADRMVARERGLSPADLRTRWQASVDDLRDSLESCDPHQRVEWVAGQLSARTLATTRLAETWIHTGDVAHAVGVGLQPAERLRHVARLAWRTLPYAFARAGRALTGPVAFDLTGPGGRWSFVPADEPLTTIHGDGVELCQVAARRVAPAATALTGDGPDTAAVLELVRTYA